MGIDVDVVIVGAGFAGLGAAMALKGSGRTVQILERASALGGTWRDNVYPGVACDVPSQLYCFAAHPHVFWSREYAPGAEIQAYLERVARSEQIDELIRFDSPVRHARWTGDHWFIEVGGPRPISLRSQSIILACGRLTEPRSPEVSGLDSFPGPMMHTARWDDDVELRGTHIALVGTGASAVQLLPQLVDRGATVTLFQRTPAWIMPKGDRRISGQEQGRWSSRPELLDEVRRRLLEDGEARYASRSGDEDAVRFALDAARSHLQRQVEDASLRELLTPHYPFGCKRVLLSDDFYPAIASSAAKLEPSALVAVKGQQLVAASGAVHEADTLVFATGFETARQPYAELIVGERSRTLAEHWSTGMTSVGSTLVAGFPDLYIVNGPNASLGHNSSILMIEEQCAFIARCLSGRTRPIRVSEAAEHAYTADIVGRSSGTPWVSGGCTNWYVDERSGRLTLLWPGTVDEFREQLGRIRPSGIDLRQSAPSALSGSRG